MTRPQIHICDESQGRTNPQGQDAQPLKPAGSSERRHVVPELLVRTLGS